MPISKKSVRAASVHSLRSLVPYDMHTNMSGILRFFPRNSFRARYVCPRTMYVSRRIGIVDIRESLGQSAIRYGIKETIKHTKKKKKTMGFAMVNRQLSTG